MRARGARGRTGHAGTRRAVPAGSSAATPDHKEPSPSSSEAPPPAPAQGSALAELEPNASLEQIASRAWVLPAILLIGLSLRLAHLLLLRNAPFFSLLVLDARAYDEWAQQIAAGEWIGRAAFWVDPLYAYVLGAVYRVFGRDLFIARLLNIALGLATAVVVWRTGLLVWRSRAAAALGALLFVIFVPAMLFEGQIEKTALSVLLIAAATYLFLRGTLRDLLAAGILAGLATLARGNAAAFVPLAALALACGWRGEWTAPTGGMPRLRRTALFLGGALSVIALATAHNYAATGELVPTTTNLGINLYLGNHAGNAHGYYEAPPFLHPSTETEVPDFRREAERRTGRTFTDNTLSQYWAAQAWDAIREMPGRFLTRTASKLRLALHNDEIPDSEGVALVSLWSPVMRAPLLWFGQLFPLAVLGAVVGWRRRGVRVMVAVAAMYLVTLLPFFMMARLRVQLVPPLAVLAGGALAWGVAVVGTRRTRSLAAAAAVLVVSAGAVFYRPEWMAQRRVSSLAIQWNNLAASLADLGRTDEAIEAWEHAVATDARAVPIALRMLGSQYQARGDYVRAENAMRRVLEIKPGSPSGRDALLKLYDEMLRDPRWQHDGDIQARRQALVAPGTVPGPGPGNPVAQAVTRARALQNEGRTDEAIAVLQEAVRGGPYDENLHYMLGNMMERHSPPEAMVAFWSDEVTRDRKPQTSHYYWAVGLARAGDRDGAIDHLRQALEIDPAHEMSQHRWGLLLEQEGRLDEAAEHLEEAVRIHPEFKMALDDAARVAERLGRTADAERYRSRAAIANPTSDRQYVYWARYLHEHGRHDAAWAEVHRMLAAHPTDPEALALRDAIRAALGDAARPAPPSADIAAGARWPLSPAARDQFVAQLAQHPRGTPAWIVFDDRDAAARAGARQLAAAFAEAGWVVRAVDPAPITMRPGLFFFAADDPPTPAAETVARALEATQLVATIGTGYRTFAAERRRDNPGWRGLELADDQQFVIAVGRPPG